MAAEDAPELRALAFPYEVIPRSESPTGAAAAKRMSQNLLNTTKDVSVNILYGAKDVSSKLRHKSKDVSKKVLSKSKTASNNLLHHAKDASESILSDTKDGASIMRRETSEFFKKDGPLSQAPSFLSEKTRSVLQKSSDHLHSRRLSRLGSQLSLTMAESKEKLKEVARAGGGFGGRFRKPKQSRFALDDGLDSDGDGEGEEGDEEGEERDEEGEEGH